MNDAMISDWIRDWLSTYTIDYGSIMVFVSITFSKRVTSYGSRLELIPSTNRITKGSKSRVVQSTLRSKFHARSMWFKSKVPTT